jgi:hypothetical protein
MTQSTEFEAIKARHEATKRSNLAPGGMLGREGRQAHTDRATLITLVEAERARADKAEAELARVLDASGTREWWLRMSKLQAATTHPKEQDHEQ